MFGLIKALPLVIMLASAGYGAHWFIVKQKDGRIDQLQTQVDTLNQHNVALQTAAQQNEATIKSLEQNAKKQAQQMNDLTLRANELAAARDEYLRIFRDHDLTKLARAKPGMIESRANKATADVFRTVETDSKELDEADQSATESKFEEKTK